MKRNIFFAVVATASIVLSSTASAQNATEWLNANATMNDGTNCALGSADYDQCTQNRENTLNSIRDVNNNRKINNNAYMEPASGNIRTNANGTTTITGNSNLQVNQSGGVSIPGTTANPAQR